MKISIITPNYNYGKFIGKTIDSVINQNYTDVEHIIVDDGSTDNSIYAIQEYLTDHPDKIKLIRQKNSGQTKALNRALSLVSGDIIGWINSDDFYCEDIFSEIVTIFKSNSEIDAVFGNFNVVDIEGRFIYMKRHFKFKTGESVFVGFGNTLTSNCIFWKKALSDKTGVFSEIMKSNMDGEYFSRLAFQANLYFFDKPIANFRKQQRSIAGNGVNDWDSIVKREIAYEKLFSYNRLKISQVVPYSIGKHLRLYYYMKRFIKKLMRADYYRIRKEKKKYNSFIETR